MASTSYTRVFTTTCNGELLSAINADGNIVPVLLQIINDPVGAPGESEFWFDNALSSGEIVSLDAILSGWACPTGGISDGNADFENAVVFSFDHDRLKNNSWLGTGGTKSSTTGYTMPFNAKVIGVTYHVGSGTARDVELYVNGVLNSTLINISTGDASDTSLGININANDRLQLRGSSGAGNTNDVIVSLYVTWR